MCNCVCVCVCVCVLVCAICGVCVCLCGGNIGRGHLAVYEVCKAQQWITEVVVVTKAFRVDAWVWACVYALSCYIVHLIFHLLHRLAFPSFKKSPILVLPCLVNVFFLRRWQKFHNHGQISHVYSKTEITNTVVGME